jgi:orotidine-5'-phosphate decarboxylase
MAGLVITSDRSIIVSADVEPEEFRVLVESIGKVDGVSGYKIGFQLGLGMGLANAVAVVREVNDQTIIIYDHQKAATDNPYTSVNFARSMAHGGVDAAILFPFTGPKVEEAYIKELQDRNIGVIVGAEMTHPQIRQSDGGYIADDSFKRMFSQAIKLGVRDFVVPGTKLDKLKEYRELFDELLGDDHYSLYSPGFVAQGGSVVAAGKIAGKSFHPIIGRGITQAPFVKEAAIKYAKEIKSTS